MSYKLCPLSIRHLCLGDTLIIFLPWHSRAGDSEDNDLSRPVSK